MFETATVAREARRKAAATVRFPAATKSLAILDKFERQENVGEGMGQKIRENDAVKGMKEAFSGLLKKEFRDTLSDRRYRSACLRIKRLGIPYTAEDVGIFSMALVQFQDEKNFVERAGLMLSALVNMGSGEEFAISTKILSVAMHDIGYRNVKKLTVHGNVGNGVGCQMNCREIIVNGDAGQWAGFGMRGGEITVKGDAGDAAGESMEGGRIIVEGNAGENAGGQMRGGEVIVRGNAGKDAGFMMHCGKVAVYGDAGDGAGNFMDGGSVLVKGNAGDKVGNWICGGEVIVRGNVGNLTGYDMKGGMIAVAGNMLSIGENITGGNIFQGERRIVKDGKRTEEELNK